MKILVLCISLLFFTNLISARSIKISKHNLSSSGGGDIRTSDTNEICIFCHTSHAKRKNAPLWNREDSNVQYTTYNSSTLKSDIGQPDGASKLCLSCHDGTIALGKILSISKELNLPNTSSGKFPKGHKGNLGTNISNDHPISFNSTVVTSQSDELKHPPSDDQVRYDRSGKIQCITCHDPHNETFSKFLVKNNIKAELCKTCHDMTAFNGVSTHDISAKIWNGTGVRPWPKDYFIGVNQNSCMNCHQSHNAAGKERLIRLGPDSEVCLACHNGNTGSNIKSEVRKNFSHSVDLLSYKNIHYPNEDIISNAVHVQCVDCHNPHVVNSTDSTAPFVNGRNKGVSGINSSGIIVNNSQFEYEICLKCHGQDRYNDPKVNRQDQNQNLKFAFDRSNKSYHPVVNQGVSRDVPSLKIKWSESSRLYCTDCHNNNNARKNGGSGPNGPHGSTHEHLLESKYLVSTSMPYQQSNYDLCWKCHRPEIVMGENFSTFKYHKKHVDEQNTPCSVCHDPHGSRQNVGLINFDTSAVFPNLNGELKFEVIGNKGYCYLQCHGEDHSPEDYER